MSQFAVLVKDILIQPDNSAKSETAVASPSYYETLRKKYPPPSLNFAYTSKSAKDRNKIDFPTKAYLIEARDSKSAMNVVKKHLKGNGLEMAILHAVESEILPTRITVTVEKV
jgi:hypothetical protein